MGFFNRKNKVLDLSERYRQQQEKGDSIRAEQGAFSQQSSPQTEPSEQVSPFPFFADTSSESSTNSDSYPTLGNSENSDDKRKKLAKRLSDITEKLEELSTQIYHLEQRFEVVERKLDINTF